MTALTATQIESFERDGYILLDAVVNLNGAQYKI